MSGSSFDSKNLVYRAPGVYRYISISTPAVFHLPGIVIVRRTTLKFLQTSLWAANPMYVVPGIRVRGIRIPQVQQ